MVSHGQCALVDCLLADLTRNVPAGLRLILTLNRPDLDAKWTERAYPFKLEVIRNAAPRGFGANHNAALKRSSPGLFCVLNPDIRIPSNPFPLLIEALENTHIGVVSPAVVDPDLIPEDHARAFPSIFTLAAKAFGRTSRILPPSGRSLYYPDWVAGMFMIFRTETLRAVGGFDERYFLYYEDVDLCARLRKSGFEIAVCTEARVIHAARRESRRNLRFALWHLKSALRFFASQPRLALGLGRRR